MYICYIEDFMFCPKCKAEYREGFYRCADCEVDLVPELPPEEEQPLEQPAEYLNLVNIETYYNRHEAELAKGFLSVNGINAVVLGDDGGGVQPGLSFSRGVRLLVKEGDVEKAKEILHDAGYTTYPHRCKEPEKNANPEASKITAMKVLRRIRKCLINTIHFFDLGGSSMKKYIRVIVIGLSLFLAAGYSGKEVLMAGDQNNGPGFEISFHHVGISVANLEESIAWYKEMLGFEEVMRMSEDAANKMEIGHIKRGNCYIELFQVEGAKPLPEYRLDPSADLRVHGVKHFGLQVDDALAAVKELKAKGVEIAMGPIDTPGVCFVFIRDNSGNALELIEFK